jgi:hypothetical protein
VRVRVCVCVCVQGGGGMFGDPAALASGMLGLKLLHSFLKRGRAVGARRRAQQQQEEEGEEGEGEDEEGGQPEPAGGRRGDGTQPSHLSFCTAACGQPWVSGGVRSLTSVRCLVCVHPWPPRVTSVSEAEEEAPLQALLDPYVELLSSCVRRKVSSPHTHARTPHTGTHTQAGTR